MLEYSELTVVRNNDGTATALGFPVNSFMLQNNKPLFAGGKKTKHKEEKELDYDTLAVPAGLVCMTETICTNTMDANTMDANTMDANTMDANEMDPNTMDANEMDPNTIDQDELVPESLYDKLFALAESKQAKKLTRRKQQNERKKKTHKQKAAKRK
jgi:hypothetical protein